MAILRQHFLEITYLQDVQDLPWQQLEPLLPEETTPQDLKREGNDLDPLPGVDSNARLKVRRWARHVWTENCRVLRALATIQAGDIEQLGALLNEAHASARDDYEVSCREPEVLVTAAREVAGVVGAHLAGAGWGVAS